MPDITTSAPDFNEADDFVDSLAADEIGFEPDAVDPGTLPVEAELRRRDRNGKPYGHSTATIAAAVCDDYLESNSIPTLRRTAPSVVADDLLGLINEKIWAQNEMLKEHLINGRKLEPVKRLGFAEVARLMGALYSVISITPSKGNNDPDLDVLAAYDDEPSSAHYGTYRSSAGHLRKIARRYCPDLTTKEFKEIIAALSDMAPRVVRGQNKDLLAVKNGVIDYNGGDPIFMDFSPEHVFLSKLDVNWNPDAENITIHNAEDGTDWDVESWMSELSDDAEIVELFWQIIGATCRPHVSWNKAAFFYATSGNNGKGTLLSLMRNMLGVGNYASIPLSDFSEPFLLEPLTRSSAILVDENDVGSYIDKSANLKAVITNDVINMNRKHRTPISHQHFGFMVQCLNDKPTFKDKSESFYRRQLFIQFTKCFTGAERKYIKDDYLQRREVLESVLKRVLTMNYYSLSEPEAVKLALEDFKESNDPVRGFWNEKRDQFVWHLLPWQFLYDLYKSWLTSVNPQAKPIGKAKFTDELMALLAEDPEGSRFLCQDKKKTHRTKGRLGWEEPMAAEYGLEDKWKVPGAKLADTYAGPIRREGADLPGLSAAEEDQAEAIAWATARLSDADRAALVAKAIGESEPDNFADLQSRLPGNVPGLREQAQETAVRVYGWVYSSGPWHGIVPPEGEGPIPVLETATEPESSPTPEVPPLSPSAAGHKVLFEQWEPAAPVAAPPSEPGAITPGTSAPPSDLR